MVIPDTFGVRGEKIISSFDYIDIASGLGYEAFYLMRCNSSAGVINILTPSSAFYSYAIESNQAPGSSTITFDTSEFNLSRTIQGTAILNIGTLASQAGADDTIKAQLWKWDGTTATAITSQFTLDLGDAAGTLSFTMPCTETLIKKGEQIRLIIIVAVVGGGEWIKWGHDPAGRTGTTGLSSSRINIPFKINL